MKCGRSITCSGKHRFRHICSILHRSHCAVWKSAFGLVKVLVVFGVCLPFHSRCGLLHSLNKHEQKSWNSPLYLSEIYFHLLCVLTSRLSVINQFRVLVVPEDGDQLRFFSPLPLCRPHVAKTEPSGAEWPLARGAGNAETVSVKHLDNWIIAVPQVEIINQQLKNVAD